MSSWYGTACFRCGGSGEGALSYGHSLPTLPTRKPVKPGFALRRHTSNFFMADGPGEEAEDVWWFGQGKFRAARAPVAPTWSQLQIHIWIESLSHRVGRLLSGKRWMGDEETKGKAGKEVERGAAGMFRPRDQEVGSGGGDI